jgi:hypothetical protein
MRFNEICASMFSKIAAANLEFRKHNLQDYLDMTDTVQHVCELAHDFYVYKNVSAVELANRSGIREQLSDLTVKNIETYLRGRPELIHFWMLRSADKRVPKGWYFKKEFGKYVVGHYPRSEHLIFEDEHTACAEFVVREVRELIE